MTDQQQQQQQQNGAPVDGEIPSWKRIWSLNEMKDSAKNWNLASDAGLLNYMQDFANRLIDKTKELENHVDGLVHDVKSTHVKVHNTFDQFLMLSHSQFIENRVYEDNSELKDGGDESVNASKSADDKPEITEEILIPKFTRAIALGLQALDKASLMNTAMEVSEATPANTQNNVVDGTMVDSLLNGEAEGQPAQEKKVDKLDHYLRYPLPHVIGSQQFKDDDFCGLFIEESDTESEETESSDEEEEEGEKPIDPSQQESANGDLLGDNTTSFTSTTEPPKQTVLFQEDGDLSTSNAFGNQDKTTESLFDDDIFSSDKPTQTKPKSNYSSLSDILGEEDDDDIFGDKKKAAKQDTPSDPFKDELAAAIGGGVPKKQEEKSDSLFGDDEPVAPKEKPKKSRSLFDDDEDDLFGSKPTASSSSSGGKKKVTFDDSMFDDSPAATTTTTTTKSTTSTTSNAKKSLTDLFSNEFMDEDEKPAPKKETKKLSFMDDDEDDLFSSKPSKPKESAKPKITSPLDEEQSSSDKEQPKKSTTSASDTSDSEHTSASTAASAATKKKPVGGVKLFDFGGDDDFLGAKKPAKDTTPKKDSTSDILGLDGDIMDRPNIPVKKHVPKTYDDSNDVLGLGSMGKEDKQQDKQQEKPKSSKSFFDDIDDNPLGGVTKKQEEKKPEEKKQQVQQEVESSPLGVEIVKEQPKVEVEEQPKAIKKPSKSFFEDIDESDPLGKNKPSPTKQQPQEEVKKVDELPQDKPKSTKSFFDDLDTPKAPKQDEKKKKSFFDDEDDVKPATSTSEDSLFGGISTAKKQQPVSTETEKSKSTEQPKKKDFFSDLGSDDIKPSKSSEDESSLFGGISKPSKSATPTKEVEKEQDNSLPVFSPLGDAQPPPPASTPQPPKKNDFFTEMTGNERHKPSELFNDVPSTTKKPLSSTNKSGKDFFSEFEDKPATKLNKDDIFEVPADAQHQTIAPSTTVTTKKEETLALNIPKPTPVAEKKSSGLFEENALSSSPLFNIKKDKLTDTKDKEKEKDAEKSASPSARDRSKSIGSVFEQQLAQKEKEKEKEKEPAKKAAPSGKIFSLLGVLALDPSKMAPGAHMPRKKKPVESTDDEESGPGSSHEKSDTESNSSNNNGVSSTRTRSTSVSSTSSNNNNNDDDEQTGEPAKLTHATKGRPKAGGRRLPTRKGASASSTSSPSTTKGNRARNQSLSSSDKSDSESERSKSKSEPSIFDSIPTTTPTTTSHKSSLDSSSDSVSSTSSKKSNNNNNTTSNISPVDNNTTTTNGNHTETKKPTKSTTKSVKSTTPTTVDSIFEDIPSVPTPTKKSAKAPSTKKATTTTTTANGNDSLFDDVIKPTTKGKKSAADDLFDDPTPSKPKPASTKKASTKKSNVDSLFD